MIINCIDFVDHVTILLRALERGKVEPADEFPISVDQRRLAFNFRQFFLVFGRALCYLTIRITVHAFRNDKISPTVRQLFENLKLSTPIEDLNRPALPLRAESKIGRNDLLLKIPVDSFEQLVGYPRIANLSAFNASSQTTDR
jgi:hypothetical protein